MFDSPLKSNVGVSKKPRNIVYGIYQLKCLWLTHWVPVLPSHRNQSIDLYSKSIDWFLALNVLIFELKTSWNIHKRRKAGFKIPFLMSQEMLQTPFRGIPVNLWVLITCRQIKLRPKSCRNIECRYRDVKILLKEFLAIVRNNWQIIVVSISSDVRAI